MKVRRSDRLQTVRAASDNSTTDSGPPQFPDSENDTPASQGAHGITSGATEETLMQPSSPRPPDQSGGASGPSAGPPAGGGGDDSNDENNFNPNPDPPNPDFYSKKTFLVLLISKLLKGRFH